MLRGTSCLRFGLLLLTSLAVVSAFDIARAQDEPSAALATTQEAKPPQASVEFLPPLTDYEKKIAAALMEPTTMDFNETPLQGVVDYLKDLHHIEIQLDTKQLEDAGVGTDTPVTKTLKGIPLRSALRLLLSDLELTAIVQDDVLLITTKESASVTLLTRVYPIGDLADDGDGYDELIGAIVATVSPASWEEFGGPADLAPVKAAKSLVISQTESGHEEILTVLRALRAARDAAN